MSTTRKRRERHTLSITTWSRKAGHFVFTARITWAGTHADGVEYATELARAIEEESTRKAARR
jgi:hypothetical protein